MSKYQAGQVWTYHARPGEQDSRLTIFKAEPYGQGFAVHIRLDGVAIKNPDAPNGVCAVIGHMPFDESSIDKSVIDMVSAGATPGDNEDGYRTWKEAADQGKAGVFTITVAEAVDFIDRAMNHPL